MAGLEEREACRFHLDAVLSSLFLGEFIHGGVHHFITENEVAVRGHNEGAVRVSLEFDIEGGRKKRATNTGALEATRMGKMIHSGYL